LDTYLYKGRKGPEKMLLIAVVCLLPLVLQASPVLQGSPAIKAVAETRGWTDEYIDMILGYLQGIITDQGLDPADLPEEEVSFSDTVLGITWHGSAKVYNGKFSGLSSIHRSGNTDFTLDGNTIELIARLGINGASAHYDARLLILDANI